MVKPVKGNLTLRKGKSEKRWVVAIQDVGRLLPQNKINAARLRAAIRWFEEQMAAGEPWPGDGQKES